MTFAPDTAGECARCHHMTRKTDRHGKIVGACSVCNYGAPVPRRTANAAQRDNNRMRANGIDVPRLPFDAA